MSRYRWMLTLLLLVSLILSACQPVMPVEMEPAEDAVKIAESDHGVWDYVVLGDSITWGLPSEFAEILEQDLGIKVVVHDRAKGGHTSSSLLENLRTNSELRQSLREAEVIVFNIPWGLIEIPVMTFEMGAPGACGGSDNQDCLRTAFGTYMTDADAIIAEIVSLRSPSEALIRTMDAHQFGVRKSKEAGTFDIINRYWRDANLNVKEEAARYNIPTVHVYDAFMGMNGTEDPRDKGLVGPDGIHTTGQGKMLMAELFRELGYEYAQE